jgi:hypothetical protein
MNTQWLLAGHPDPFLAKRRAENFELRMFISQSHFTHLWLIKAETANSPDHPSLNIEANTG